MNNTFFFLLLSFMISSLSLKAQKPFTDIEMTINNFEGDYVLLAYYFGDKQYVKDTIFKEGTNHFHYTQEEPLDAGEYIVALPPDYQYFQLLVPSDDQKYKVTVDAKKLGNSTFTGSKENELLKEYSNYLKEKRKLAIPLSTERDSLQKQIDSTELSGKLTKQYEARIEAIKTELEGIGKEVISYQKSFIEKHKSTLAANLIGAAQNVHIPDVPEDVEDKQLWRYRYMKDHYFDYLDIGNPDIIRTSFIHNKIEQYMDRMVPKHPDSIIYELEGLFEKSYYCSDFYKFYVNHYLNKYAGNKIVGFDKVYVHLAANHYADSLLTPWVVDSVRQKIAADGSKMQPLLLGNIAPDINMTKEDGTKINLHGIDSKYTILYFFDPDCGHCKKSMPKLDTFWQNNTHTDVKLMTVCSKYYKDETKCWEFIEERGNEEFINTFDPYYKSEFRKKYNLKAFPVLYILDADKRIRMSKIGSESVGEVLDKIRDGDKDMKPEDLPTGEIWMIDKKKVYELQKNCPNEE